jgi:ferredoxin-thioredoxin reductase catalytic subunit
MSEIDAPSPEEIDKLYEKLDKDARDGGYFLNPDLEHTKALVESLLINEKRYGYWACPCRLSDGDKQEDLDIICPCDYRDADLNEFGTCYCGLYVSQDVADGKKAIQTIPERRPVKDKRSQNKDSPAGTLGKDQSLPIWRCRVCGYLCAREEPPLICPICKAKQDRFERFS